jgi:hypothetical protein
MLNLKKFALGVAMTVGAAGAMGMATTQAKAAEIGVYVGAPVAYVPPCPGAGYAWVAGYYSGRVWIPGRWNFVGVRGPVAPIARFDVRGGFDHRGFAPRFDHFRR